MATHPDLRTAVAIVMAINLAGGIVYVLAAQPTPGFEADPFTRWLVEHRGTALLLAAVAGPLLGVLWYSIWTSLVTWLGRAFGGTGTLRGTFAAFAFAGVPPAALGIPLQVVPAVFGPFAMLAVFPLSLVIGGWGIVLSVFAIRESHRISTGSAVGVIAILTLLVFVVFLVAGIGLMAGLV